MPAEGQRTKIAVLIDADNASPKQSNAIFTEIAKLGEAIVRRVYGDFGNPNLRGWSDKLAAHALIPIQTVAYTKGKNASDISLVIDAMDLMHQGVYDAFCIISSDSDFTRLAQRLRESGAEVYGFGERKTPDSFRHSCRRFFLVENLAREQAEEMVEAEPELQLPEVVVEKPASAIPIISRAYEKHVGDYADGWVPIRQLHRTIANIEPDFDARTYGEHRLGDLAVGTGAFEIKQIKDRGWWITMKAKGVKPARTVAKKVDGGPSDDGLRRTLSKGTMTGQPRQHPQTKRPAPRRKTAGDKTKR